MSKIGHRGYWSRYATKAILSFEKHAKLVIAIPDRLQQGEHALSNASFEKRIPGLFHSTCSLYWHEVEIKLNLVTISTLAAEYFVLSARVKKVT